MLITVICHTDIMRVARSYFIFNADFFSENVKTAVDMVRNAAQPNVTGHPSLSINAGFLDNLPVGMMITGKHFDDSTVLRVARAFEKIRDGE